MSTYVVLVSASPLGSLIERNRSFAEQTPLLGEAARAQFALARPVAKIPAVNEAVLEQDHAKVLELLVSGVDANTAWQHWKPVLLAVYFKDLSMLKLLIAYNGDVNATSDTFEGDDGQPPNHLSALMIAAEEGYLEIVRCLLENDANVDVVDTGEGGTPMAMAAQGGHLEIVKLLVAKGAKVDGPTAACRTPLFAATLAGHVAIVEFLLAKEALVDLGDAEDSMTPLGVAAQKGHVKLVKILIAHGACANACATKNLNPRVKKIIQDAVIYQRREREKKKRFNSQVLAFI